MNSKKSSLSSLMLNSWDSNDVVRGKKVENQSKHEISKSSDDILDFLKKSNEKKTSDSNDSLLGFLEEKKSVKHNDTNKPKTIVKTSVNTSLLDLLNKDSNKLKENVIPTKETMNEQRAVNADDLLKIVESSITVSNKNVHDATITPQHIQNVKLESYTSEERLKVVVTDIVDVKLSTIAADFQLKLEKMVQIQENLELTSKRLDIANKNMSEENKEFSGFKDLIISAMSHVNQITDKTNENYDKTCSLLNEVGNTKTKLEITASHIDFVFKAFSNEISTSLAVTHNLHSDIQENVHSMEDMKNYVLQHFNQEKDNMAREKRDWMNLKLKMSEFMLEQERKIQRERSDMDENFTKRVTSIESKEKKFALLENMLKIESEKIASDQYSLQLLKDEILDIKRDLERQKRDLALEKSSFNTDKELFESEKIQILGTLKEITSSREIVAKERKRMLEWSENNRSKEEDMIQEINTIQAEKESLYELKKEMLALPIHKFRSRSKNEYAINRNNQEFQRRSAFTRIEKHNQNIQKKLNLD